VLVLDADQVAHPSILTALAGYMRFPDLGFIQSRQVYVVPEGDPFFSQDPVFYEAVQLGYDDRDTVVSCGSGVLYRRAALEANEGFSAWNVVEDLTTSYDLHSRGWRSFYYPHAVTLGLAPADIWGVYRQRGQWALDTMRLFFWDNPLWKRGLRASSRMTYLVIPLSYFCAGVVFPFFFLIPIWTYLTGGSVLAGSELQFVVMRGIYGILMALALRALFRRHQAGRQFQMLAGLFPVYLSGCLRAIFYPRSREAAYRPNNVPRPASRPAFVAVLPQLALAAANAVLPFYAIAAGTAQPRLIIGNAFISALAIWSLLPAIAAALGRNVWVAGQTPYGLQRDTAS
jgi:cellulose synthase (UDP-forming)